MVFVLWEGAAGRAGQGKASPRGPDQRPEKTLDGGAILPGQGSRFIQTGKACLAQAHGSTVAGRSSLGHAKGQHWVTRVASGSLEEEENSSSEIAQKRSSGVPSSHPLKGPQHTTLQEWEGGSGQWKES